MLCYVHMFISRPIGPIKVRESAEKTNKMEKIHNKPVLCHMSGRNGLLLIFLIISCVICKTNGHNCH